MTYPAAPQQPTRRRPWVLIIGATLLLVALLLCSVGGFMSLGPVKDLADRPEQTAPQTVQLTQGDTRAVWSQTSGATCTVTGPGGPVSDSSSGGSSMTWGDKTLERVMSFEADQTGDFTVSCTAPFVIGDNVSVGGIVMASIGSALCCISVVLLVVGLVLWLSRRRT
jgi:hypothetical protein